LSHQNDRHSLRANSKRFVIDLHSCAWRQLPIHEIQDAIFIQNHPVYSPYIHPIYSSCINPINSSYLHPNIYSKSTRQMKRGLTEMDQYRLKVTL
jgi:hypothetical protein